MSDVKYISAGDTVAERQHNIREAIALYVDGLREDGAAVPPPTTSPLDR